MRPFLKWAGSKVSLIDSLLPHLPAPGQFRRYFEPFCGSAALFFALKDEASPWQAFSFSVVLADANRRLVDTFKGVRDYPALTLKHYKDLVSQHDDPEIGGEAFFQGVRAIPPVQTGPQQTHQNYLSRMAAWFLFLNKAGFNGLYRENLRGGMNVPWGGLVRAASLAKNFAEFCDRVNSCSSALRSSAAVLEHDDFESLCTRYSVGDGDLVYFDPPYAPVSATARFSAYSSGGFTYSETLDKRNLDPETGRPLPRQSDQLRLRNLAERLIDAGATVILSNSDVPLVRQLYGNRGFELHEVTARGSISARSEGRGGRKELIIVGRPGFRV